MKISLSKYQLLLVTVILIINCFYKATAQGVKSIKTKQPVTTAAQPQAGENIHLVVYHNAAVLGDYSTAIQSLHYLIAASGDNTKYIDTLAIAYLNAGMYTQSYTISESILKNNSANLGMLEIKAISAVQLQQPVIAVDAYTSLFDKTQKLSFGFQKLQLEYRINRLSETVATANRLLQLLPANDSTKVEVLKADKKSSQVVKLKAAVLNIQALAWLDLKDKDKAIAALKDALLVNPEYEAAKADLLKLEKDGNTN